MASQENIMTCPLCGYKTNREYAILLHMEELHAEGNSPFVANPDRDAPGPGGAGAVERDASSDEDAGIFVECPIEGCLEQIGLAELEDHIDFHAIEENEEVGSDGGGVAADATPSVADGGQGYQSPYSRPKDEARANREHGHERSQTPTDHLGTVDAWKKIFGRKQGRSTKDVEVKLAPGKTPRKRLGKSELGKHAYEHQMPDSLVALLRRGKYASAEGIIPVLARLLDENPLTEHAYLCHPAVQHISKLRGEGGFCGYRNIQMLSSYIIGTRAEGAEKLGGRIPSIFRIQDYIENAWDMGINASGRIETGGIKGTRKYIGTPEALAMFLGLEIPCEVEGFKFQKQGEAEAALLSSVQQYFESAPTSPASSTASSSSAGYRRDKVRLTGLPPIYFQHRGHSLTIVGLEQRVSGSLKLLVFDPMFRDPGGVVRLVERASRSHGHADAEGDRGRDKDGRGRIRTPIHRRPDSALRLYRRGHHYLRKYHEFELLRLKTKPHITNNS